MSIHSLSHKNISSIIGWFRLHEATVKNEHERAFLTYRLLMHSYCDIAYQKEIKALLHYYFDELPEAIKLLKESFQLYIEKEDVIKAFMIYQLIQKMNGSVTKEHEIIANIIKKNSIKYQLFIDIL